MKLWSNKQALPSRGSPARSLHLALPLFKDGVLDAPTRIGLEKVDKRNYMDGIHKRNLHLQVFGFGLVLKKEWNSDGGHGEQKRSNKTSRRR
jgi:hypothetical protein